MVELKFGSVFDDKCDLLIIPCHSGGGVTNWVSESLISNGLTAPNKYIPFGNVDYQTTNFNLENSQFIGYASSVDLADNKSTPQAIESISKDILSFSSNKKIRRINIPLLGTGAGGLSPHKVFEIFAKKFEKTDLELVIFTPTRDTYDNLLSSNKKTLVDKKPSKLRNPRVFISYTGDNKKNAEWVKSLAERLRNNGVDARLDKFHLTPGADLPQWMTNEIIQAEKVILVCDHNYMVKADIKKQGGVGWETMIIQGDMLSQGEAKTKYIALVRENEINKALPIYMKSKLAIDWGGKNEISDEEFKDLLYTLFDCDIEPELGEIPKYIHEKLKKS